MQRRVLIFSRGAMTIRIAVCCCAAILGLGSTAPARSSPQDISLTSVASAANADGRAEVLAIGQDGNLYQRWQVNSGWSLWTRLATGQFSDATLSRAADGRLYAFGVDTGQLIIFAQAIPNGGWVTQVYRTGDGLQKLSVTLDNSGHFVVAAIKGGSLWVIKGVGDQALIDSNWTDWALLGGDQLTSVSAVRDGDGRVVIATLTRDSQLQIVRQVSATDPRWSRWQSLSGGKDGDLTMVVSRIEACGCSMRASNRACRAEVSPRPQRRRCRLTRAHRSSPSRPIAPTPKRQGLQKRPVVALRTRSSISCRSTTPGLIPFH
jgi:hypothetical protein